MCGAARVFVQVSGGAGALKGSTDLAHNRGKLLVGFADVGGYGQVHDSNDLP